MPDNNPAVEALARKLGALTHPDGTFMSFPQNDATWVGYPTETQNEISGLNKRIAEAIINTLEADGYRTVPAEKVIPPRELAGSRQIVTLACVTCGQDLGIQSTIDDRMVVRIPARALYEGVVDLKCPHTGRQI